MGLLRGAASTSLLLIFLVIVAGSVVRMTGSGMGCPDWPKCFGHLIPPTEEDQVLWHAGQEFNKGEMILHNETLWSANSNFRTGDEFNAENWEEYTQHDYAKFNAAHTWTEYINRLFGAASGIPVLLLFILSLIKIRSKPWVFVLSALTLFMLGYEAWLGKLVVDGNLVPNQITKHMIGSLVIVALLLLILTLTSERKRIDVSRGFKTFLIFTLVMVVAQILLGTQVREQIDEIAMMNSDRSTWIDMLNNNVLIHRSFSIAIFLLGIGLFWQNWKNDYALWSVGAFVVLVLLEAAAGAIMYYLNMPRFLQPVHLLLSTGLFTLLVWAVFKTKTLKN